MRRFLTTLLTLMVVAAPTGADPVRFHNPVLRLSATYDDTRWHVVKSADRNTVFGIIWKSLHGDNLAFCALQMADSPDGSEGRVDREPHGLGRRPRRHPHQAQSFHRRHLAVHRDRRDLSRQRR